MTVMIEMADVRSKEELIEPLIKEKLTNLVDF